MANDAYRLKVDTSLPRAVRQIDELIDGEAVYETEGRNYAKGQYVLAENMTPRDRKRAEDGDLDHLLESASLKEAQAAGDSELGVFIAEHEAERVALEGYGHEVVPRDQVLELKAAGADDAKKALQAVKDEGTDERPNLTAQEVPSLAEVSLGGVENVPKDSEHVDEAKLGGVVQPPGVEVGEAKAAAEGASQPRKRGRPSKSETTSVEQRQAVKESESK